MGLPYRAVDKEGRTADFLLSKGVTWKPPSGSFPGQQGKGVPRVITLDGYAASHRAVAELEASGTLPGRLRIRSCKYVNNVIEQDHRRIKQRIRPML
jgi:transposase-like protein